MAGLYTGTIKGMLEETFEKPAEGETEEWPAKMNGCLSKF